MSMKNRYARLLSLLLLVPLAACANGTGPDGPSPTSVVQGDVEYMAETLIMESFPVQLQTIVRMRNRRSSRVEVQLGSGCPVLLRVYRNEARTQLVWDQGSRIACTKEIQIVSLTSGETAERSTRTNAREILGDSLPDGRYYLSAYVQVVGARLTIPAGAADLAVPRW
jgi:hypothetical protein